MSAAPSPVAAGVAVLVFADSRELRLLRLLKPGFRHCFVALNDGRHWITVDPLLQQTEIAVAPVPPEFDLAAFFRAQGCRTLTVPLRPAPRRPCLPLPLTCVETVKRVLGIRAWWLWTPWQLFQYSRSKYLTLGCS